MRLLVVPAMLALLAACNNEAPEPEPEATEIPEELAGAAPAVSAAGGIGTPMAERVAVIGVLNSAVSLYYYLRIVVYMMLKNEPSGSEPHQSPALAVAMVAAVVVTLFLGIYPQALFEFAEMSARTLGTAAATQALR